MGWSALSSQSGDPRPSPPLTLAFISNGIQYFFNKEPYFFLKFEI